jgi:hypothetical protein
MLKVQEVTITYPTNRGNSPSVLVCFCFVGFFPRKPSTWHLLKKNLRASIDRKISRVDPYESPQYNQKRKVNGKYCRSEFITTYLY